LGLIDLGHLDRFRLGITLSTDKSIGNDDHLGDVALTHIGVNGIGQGTKVFLADRPAAELADALSRLATD
jgi:hypothetical protein